jgi:hypothetical protein
VFISKVSAKEQVSVSRAAPFEVEGLAADSVSQSAPSNGVSAKAFNAPQPLAVEAGSQPQPLSSA